MVSNGLSRIGKDSDEEPNIDSKIFYRMLEDCGKSLYPSCTSYTKIIHS